ncbi:hypothetical protein QYE76_015395 [Lolium multiflorum]|uniref:Reverse transcriptase zinc-binding domain-containing protein n=1 Tax=Lolium multiflorum TaxID=4521 RepID=A0AAD8U6R1_LOLMU|nr:hypothetical protein QYE76_015395 [Lolium multiflorum]
MPTQGRSGRLHSCHSQRSRSARPKNSKFGTPRPPTSSGEQTDFHRTLHRSRRKNKSVAMALNDHRWVHDMRRNFPPELLPEFLHLWRTLQTVVLRPETPDKIRWILTTDGCYSAASAYHLHFEGQTRSIAPAMIWSPWAPPKCRVFAWLLLQNRLWCADRLQRRQCPNSYFCPMCIRNLETSWHLFFECPFTRSIHYTTALEPQQISWLGKPLTPTESRSGISFADQHCRSP